MIRINLLPQEARRTAGAGFKLDRMKVVPLATLAVSLASCLCVMMVQGTRLHAVESQVAQARASTTWSRRNRS
jgi:hypothetical protein